MSARIKELSNYCDAPVEQESFGHLGSEDICTKCKQLVTFSTHLPGEVYNKIPSLKEELTKSDSFIIQFKCDICKRISNKPGALLFSPPNLIRGSNNVIKYHVCTECFDKIIK
jgi:hypothetical protein